MRALAIWAAFLFGGLLSHEPSYASAGWGCVRSAAAPHWYLNQPTGKRFDYVVGRAAVLPTPEAARDAAFVSALTRVLQQEGVVLSSETHVHKHIRRSQQRDTLSQDWQESVVLQIDREKTKAIRIVGWFEETCSDGHRAGVLIRFPKEAGTLDDEQAETSPVAPTLQSLLVPGLGQFANGQGDKGLWLGSGTALALGTALLAGWVSYDAAQMAQGARQERLRQYHHQQHEGAWWVASTTTVLGAGLWGWSIADAAWFTGWNQYE